MLELKKLERGKWEAKVGPDINDPASDNYRIVQTSDALSLVMCSSKPYSGWLAKHVAQMYEQAEVSHFRYTLMIDDATLHCAQVIETDCKNTDRERWTYDFSGQFNIAKGWAFEVDNENWTWADTGIRIDPLKPYIRYEVEIEYLANYQNKQSAIAAVIVDGERYDVEPLRWIPAKMVGWAPSEIVVQLQQCNNHEPGGYTLRFSDIGYEFE